MDTAHLNTLSTDCLMKVLFKFHNLNDVRNFMLVNKKCHKVISFMTINPYIRVNSYTAEFVQQVVSGVYKIFPSLQILRIRCTHLDGLSVEQYEKASMIQLVYTLRDRVNAHTVVYSKPERLSKVINYVGDSQKLPNLCPFLKTITDTHSKKKGEDHIIRRLHCFPSLKLLEICQNYFDNIETATELQRFISHGIQVVFNYGWDPDFKEIIRVRSVVPKCIKHCYWYRYEGEDVLGHRNAFKIVIPNKEDVNYLSDPLISSSAFMKYYHPMTYLGYNHECLDHLNSLTKMCVIDCHDENLILPTTLKSLEFDMDGGCYSEDEEDISPNNTKSASEIADNSKDSSCTDGEDIELPEVSNMEELHLTHLRMVDYHKKFKLPDELVNLVIKSCYSSVRCPPHLTRLRICDTKSKYLKIHYPSSLQVLQIYELPRTGLLPKSLTHLGVHLFNRKPGVDLKEMELKQCFGARYDLIPSSVTSLTLLHCFNCELTHLTNLRKLGIEMAITEHDVVDLNVFKLPTDLQYLHATCKFIEKDFDITHVRNKITSTFNTIPNIRIDFKLFDEHQQ